MHSPCCTCGGTATCTDLATDDVDDYTQVTGTWTNDEFDRIVTTDADALLVLNADHPDGLSVGTIAAKIVFSEDTGQVRLLMGYTDPNNYLFLEIDVVDGVAPVGYDLWLGTRIGGVDTYLDGWGRGGGTGVFRICYNGARLGGGYGVTTTLNGQGVESPLTGSFGDKVGIEVIGLTGGIIVEDVEFYPINDQTCGQCPPACVNCKNSEDNPTIPLTPKEVQVHFLGVANAACANCVAVFDDVTFLLENVGPDTPDPLGWSTRGCILTKETDDCFEVGATPEISVEYGAGGGGAAVSVLINVNDDGAFAITDRSSNQCDEELDKVGGTNTGFLQQCDWTGVTATLTPNTVD